MVMIKIILGPLLSLQWKSPTTLLLIDNIKIYDTYHSNLQNDLDSATLWSEKWDMYFIQPYEENIFTLVIMQR